MQFEKDEIRARIAAAARAEFLEKGFEKSSIRTITAKAKTSKSNLYNYFEDKDGLFCRLLEPTVAKIREGLLAAERYNVPKAVGDYTFDAQKRVFEAVFRFIAENAEDVRLLLFKAQGSSLQDFRHEVLEAFTENMVRWTRSFQGGERLTRFFVRSVCGFYLGVVEQAFLCAGGEEIKAAAPDLLAFLYAGWRGVLQNHEGSHHHDTEN